VSIYNLNKGLGHYDYYKVRFFDTYCLSAEFWNILHIVSGYCLGIMTSGILSSGLQSYLAKGMLVYNTSCILLSFYESTVGQYIYRYFRGGVGLQSRVFDSVVVWFMVHTSLGLRIIGTKYMISPTSSRGCIRRRMDRVEL